MNYLPWLVGITAAFVVLERLAPWRPGHPLLRPGWRRDFAFLALNGHVFGVLTAGLNGWLALEATRLLWQAGLRLDASPVSSWPFWAQFAVFLLVSDFLQWLNNPRMHLWHHDASDEGGVAKNFGIVFSVWDFLFRTAHWPRERSPQRLGYPGDGEMPEGFVGELAWPLTRRS